MAIENLPQANRSLPKKEISKRPLSLPSETLTTGKEVIQRVLGMIDNAKTNIDMQFYTFEADATGCKILDALAKAKKRNPKLKIRLLVDNSISMFHDSGFVDRSEQAREKRDKTYEIFNEMKEDGILDVKVTNWFPRNPVINSLHLYSNVIHRDHKKLVCVDTRDLQNPNAEPMALITSANIAWYHEDLRKEVGRVYHGTDGPVPFLARDFEYSFRNAERWERVYSVRSIGEYLQKYGLRRGFWQHVGQDFLGSIVRNPQRPGERMVFKPGLKGHDSAVLTDSFWGKLPIIGNKIGAREATNELFSMLELAQPGDTVTTFTPFPGIWSLTGELIKAAKRGVHVELIISQSYEDTYINPKKLKGITKFLKPIYVSWPKKVVGNGIALYEYKGEKEKNKGMLHAKGALWIRKEDGTVRTLIGSTNFSKEPISGMNREIAVVEESFADSEPLVAYVESLKADSERVILPNTNRRNRAT